MKILSYLFLEIKNKGKGKLMIVIDCDEEWIDCDEEFDRLSQKKPGKDMKEAK